jgi:uncharacterized protein (TIGR02453 family)
MGIKSGHMAYFSKDFNEFFKELAANNNKDWFDANRSRYKNTIKEPFENFIADLIAELSKHDPGLKGLDPKKTIFRINRDIRFSKDKSPYKLNRSAAISKGGKKDRAGAGIYLQLGPEMVAFAGGAYEMHTDQLIQLRNYIAKNQKVFRKAIESKEFREHYGEIRGEENKRLPNKELTEAAEKEPMIYKKQMYYWTELSPDLVHSDKLMPTAIEYFKAAKPVREFLRKALA